LELLDPDRELGADQFTEAAGGTLEGLDHVRRMIALQIESFGADQNTTGTELDAVRTTLAAVLVDPHGSADARQGIGVKGSPPESALGSAAHESPPGKT
jgi:hypothetical protein